MAIRSSAQRYGAVAKTVHWLTVVLILALLVTGRRAGETAADIDKLALLRVHVPLGIAVLCVTVFRLVWWWKWDNKPQAAPMPGWQARSARVVHGLFYAVILGMAASGIGTVVMSGVGPLLLAGGEAALPDFWQFPPRTPHGMGARLLVGLIVVHAGAALYHHVVKKDGLLRRMWF